jgi:ribA/ribD-fused uncharacterized protein
MIKIPYYENSNFVFHNFSSHAIKYNGITYPTAEHAFHSAKFEDEKIKEEIRNAKTPLDVFYLGKKYKYLRKENWDDIKVNVLYEILTEKVKQHAEVIKALLNTGTEEIIEDNPNDDFWGNGKDGKGENQTGKILMRIREEFE